MGRIKLSTVHPIPSFLVSSQLAPRCARRHFHWSPPAPTPTAVRLPVPSILRLRSLKPVPHRRQPPSPWWSVGWTPSLSNSEPLAFPFRARRPSLRSTLTPSRALRLVGAPLQAPLPGLGGARPDCSRRVARRRSGHWVLAAISLRRAQKGEAERAAARKKQQSWSQRPPGASKMPQVMVVARNFMDMVAALPASKLDTLYDSAFICEAVLRSLPPLAKKYVLQMLYVLTPVAAAAMQAWVRDEYAAKHKVAIDRLLQLRIFVEVRDRRKEVSYKMNQKFQGNMQNYLVDGGSLPRTPLPPSIIGRLPTVSELEDYALEQWERFLLQLINSSQVEKGTAFSTSMMRTFQRGLLSSRDGETPKLTENGFQFLLMETNAQLWYIMREYISSAEERGVDPTELISFLLELSFHTLGAAYSLSTLTDVQRIAIRDLAELGLIKLQQGRKDSWFIPTKLATNLSASLSDTSSSKEGFVVVETNFRMYAYSTSKLHCEILRLFSRVEYQLPNLIAGAITKESIYGAFDNGITAEQIISFLQQNAHPRVADKIPTVPENVADQIRLWENDRNRVEMVPSYLYEDFPSKELFEQCCDHARDSGYLLWEDSKRMRLIVQGEFHPEMREFLRRQR